MHKTLIIVFVVHSASLCIVIHLYYVLSLLIVIIVHCYFSLLLIVFVMYCALSLFIVIIVLCCLLHSNSYHCLLRTLCLVNVVIHTMQESIFPLLTILCCGQQNIVATGDLNFLQSSLASLSQEIFIANQR